MSGMKLTIYPGSGMKEYFSNILQIVHELDLTSKYKYIASVLLESELISYIENILFTL